MKLIAYEIEEDEVKYFKEIAANLIIEIVYTEKTLNDKTIEMARGCDGVSILGQSKIDSAIMDQLKALNIHYLSTRTIRYDHIDMDYAKRIGIKVAYSSYDSKAVAEFVRGSDSLKKQQDTDMFLYADAVVRNMVISSVYALVSFVNRGDNNNPASLYCK
ncbi:hypothetical protein P22_2762 [Propionispora sp. 2/2-37]|uniref:hypothetical protein n=1 Tax=Propionispora sp. 2/2-37 TaxID=1677858 RepID=UPI0006BB6684|nr:hypothetical protein [Propionispora sp. 2/2-37]CUH96672.1 hypothetical protein P22_2762 [Propionispora sp. 2/2-37]